MFWPLSSVFSFWTGLLSCFAIVCCSQWVIRCKIMFSTILFSSGICREICVEEDFSWTEWLAAPAFCWRFWKIILTFWFSWTKFKNSAVADWFSVMWSIQIFFSSCVLESVKIGWRCGYCWCVAAVSRSSFHWDSVKTDMNFVSRWMLFVVVSSIETGISVHVL